MNKRGLLYILLGAILWGTTGTSQGLAPEGAQPLAIGTLRMLVGGMALMAAYLLSQKKGGSPLRFGLPPGPVIAAALCMAAYQVLFFAGVARTGVAVGTVVGIGSSPVWAGLLGFLLRGEQPGLKWGVATLLAVAGCALLALTGQEIEVDLLGMLLAVGAGGVYALFSAVSKGLLENHPVEKVMAVIFTLGAVMLAPLLLSQDLSWLADPRGIVVILHLGLLATALAYTLFGKGLTLVPVATAVTLSLAEPLTASLLGVMVLGERLTLQAVAGMALIFGGLFVISFLSPNAENLKNLFEN